MTPEMEEQAVLALEKIGDGLSSIAEVMWKRYHTEFPLRRKPEPATWTRVKTDDDKLREEQGGTGEETLEDWLNLNPEIGPREREYLLREEIARKAADTSQGGTGSEPA